MQSKKIILWIARIVPAVILLQTLFFKFTAHPQSVELFTKLWMEPTWRIWSGVVELFAWLLLLFWGKWVTLWAVISVFLMLWAIYFHLTILGIDQLFWMAIVVLICALRVIFSTWKTCPVLGRFAKK